MADKSESPSIDETTAFLEQMFVDLIQRQRIERGQRPALRTVFLKQHGVCYASLQAVKDLRDDLKVGVFADGDKRPCWIRLSSDTQPTSPDLHTTMGIGIKVFDVPGPKLFGAGDTADFILQNHDVFFIDDATEFAAFTKAGVIDGNYPKYLRNHPKTAKILDEMAKPEASCLTASYWGLLPHKFGNGKFVKYKLEPVGAQPGEPFDDANYLGIDLGGRLRRGEARFQFQVQLRTDPETMPLDKATVKWKSPWIHIADLVIPRQDIEQRGQAGYGENLSFNIWRTPPDQQPQGSIAEARRRVYEGSADQRRQANGVTLTEPGEPGPRSQPDDPSPLDKRIVSAGIYPPIGICRVGGAKAYFLGPEVPYPAAQKAEHYRAESGKLKREAARFRIYGFNARGEAVQELTADDCDELEWTVELGNQKSSWYTFQLALDIPEAADAPPSLLRNAAIAKRERLEITPGPRTISGKNKHGKKYAFGNGAFMTLGKVYLGSLRTDEDGRLVVLGGHGVSASVDGGPAVTFANNEGWHDDTSDGPVTAKVIYKGAKLKVDPAWVVTAPPNYAPQLKSVRTMWDLMRDVAIDNGMLAKPDRPSFQEDIRPIFQRMHDLQWVNQGFAAAFGFGGQFDYSTDEWMVKLSDASPANLELRRTLANAIRHYDVDSWSPSPWPWVYGDAMSIPAAHTPRQNTELSGFQLWALEQWVIGNFDTDYSTDEPPRELSDYPVAEQPDVLTRAAMDHCLADAFHPGCEMTWPMRLSGMYMAAFRLKHRKAKFPEPDYGAQLNSDVLTLPDGPIMGGQSPGSITRWMAIPWQTDTASCRSGYDKSYDPYLPTFWPARVPNQVMSETAYRIVKNGKNPMSVRLQAFANRADWLEPLGLDKSYTHQINHMIAHFDDQGVVVVRDGVEGPNFPARMQVADRPEHVGPKHAIDSAQARRLSQRMTAQPAEVDNLVPDAEGPTDLSTIDKVRRFPHGLGRGRS